jgi:hypothetical protein
MNAPQQKNAAANLAAFHSNQEFFNKFNKGPIKSMGQYLDESGPDAVIVAMGIQAVQAQEAENNLE